MTTVADHVALGKTGQLDVGSNDEMTTDGALPALTMAYGYNPDGSRQSLEFRTGTNPEPAGLARLAYGWDPEERLSVLLDTYDFRFAEWSYRKDDRVQTALGSNLATTRKGYTPRGLLASLKLSPFAIPARPSVYAGPSGLETDPMRYDASGRRTGLGVTGPEFPGSASYGYDPLGRLTQETPERGGAPSVTHAYDLAGNHWYTAVVNNQTMDWYGFDGTLGGIDLFSPSGPAPFNGSDQIAPWSYDPFGGLTGSPSRKYAFDAEERLTKVTDGSGSTLLTAGYQGDGRRAWKADGSGNRAYFVYDGDDPVIEQVPGPNGTSTLSAVNLFGAEGLLSRRVRQADGSYATTSYQFDPSGNVAARLNGAGTVTGCDLYAAYGARTARQGTVDPSDPWGYEAQFGYYGDRETGLLLLGSRYYDPQAGRFVTRDPIGAEGGANLYAYADGDPVDEVDPDGTGAVGAPNLAEGLIPVVGSGWQSLHDVQTGHPYWAALNAGLAISDIIPAKALLTIAGKGLIVAGARLIVRAGEHEAEDAAEKIVEKEAEAAAERRGYHSFTAFKGGGGSCWGGQRVASHCRAVEGEREALRSGGDPQPRECDRARAWEGHHPSGGQRSLFINTPGYLSANCA